MTPVCRLALPQELPFSQAGRGHVGGGDPYRVASSTSDRGENGTSANRGLLVGHDASFGRLGDMTNGAPCEEDAPSGSRGPESQSRRPRPRESVRRSLTAPTPWLVTHAAVASAGPVGGPAPEPG